MTSNNNRDLKKGLKILFVSAKPEVDFSTFYIPLNRIWRSI